MILNNIWLINLDQSIDRLKSIQTNFNRLNLRFNRFSAIYGKNLTNDEIIKNTNILCRTLLCNYAMVGCNLSHKILWSQLLNDENTYSYLILEDDVVLNEKSIDIIKKLDILQTQEEIDIINLYGLNGTNTIYKKIYQIDDIDVGYAYFPLTTTAYMITKKGAKTLLDNINKITYGIDYEIAYRTKISDIKYYVTNPYVVTTMYDQSTISPNKNCIILYLCKRVNLKFMHWLLNSQCLNINMVYQVNNIMILYLILYCINKKYIQSELLHLFILFELYLLFFHINLTNSK